ncbi:hypothetical protein WJX72_001361 [[Myrmecia] bisecta]|uniref:Uncharacterized protein n=1 Tax=[Myrmecia] bisecta TaxID=41462 RepID=A0AAW1QE55_9CHLO
MPKTVEELKKEAKGVMPSNHKTVLCNYWRETGSCKQGDSMRSDTISHGSSGDMMVSQAEHMAASQHAIGQLLPHHLLQQMMAPHSAGPPQPPPRPAQPAPPAQPPRRPQPAPPPRRPQPQVQISAEEQRVNSLAEAVAGANAAELERLLEVYEIIGQPLTQNEVFSYVWRAAVEVCSAEVLEVLLRWWQDEYGDWTYLSVNKGPPEIEEPGKVLIVHEVIVASLLHNGAISVLRQIIQARPSALLDRYPSEQPLGATPLMLAIRIGAHLNLISLLAPADMPETIWGKCFAPGDQQACLTPIEEADQMRLAPGLDDHSRRHFQNVYTVLEGLRVRNLQKYLAEQKQRQAEQKKAEAARLKAQREEEERLRKAAAARARAEAEAAAIQAELDRQEAARQAKERKRQEQAAAMAFLARQLKLLEEYCGGGDADAAAEALSHLHAPEWRSMLLQKLSEIQYDKCLKDCFWAAALNGHLGLIRLLEDELKQRKWVQSHVYNWPRFQTNSQLLLEEALRKGQDAVVIQALQQDPTIITLPKRPPLLTALYTKAGMEVVEAVLKATIDSKRPAGVQEEEKGVIALSLAMQQWANDWPTAKEIFHMLLKAGSLQSTFVVEKKRLNVLHYAVKLERLDMAVAILEKAKAEMGKRHLLREFVDQLCEDMTALYRAVQQGSLDLISVLLAHKGSPLLNCHDETPLHLAIKMLWEADQDQQTVVQWMLKALDSNERSGLLNGVVDWQGHTVLVSAVVHRKLVLVNLLMEHGASLTALAEILSNEHKGSKQVAATRVVSPLSMAVRAYANSKGEDAEVAAILAAFLHGWDLPRTRTALSSGLTPKDAQLVAEWLQLHKEVTLEPFIKTKARRSELVQQAVDNGNVPLLELLVDQKGPRLSDVRLHNIIGRAPANLIRRLLAGGADPGARDNDLGAFLIHKAVEACDYEVLDILRNSGAQLRVADKSGNTPLHWAVRHLVPENRADLVKWLVEADPTLLKIINKQGATPVEHARAKAIKKLLAERVEQADSSAAQRRRSSDGQEGGQAEDGSLKRSADEMEADEPADGTFRPLVDPSESEERKRRRIGDLLDALPTAKSAAEVAAEAAKAAARAVAPDDSAAAPQAAAEGKAHAEGEHHQRLQERLAVLTPEVLPERDIAAMQEAGVEEGDAAMVAGMQRAVGEAGGWDEQVAEVLRDSPWEFIITRNARQEWAAMDRPFKLMVLGKLKKIGQDFWQTDGTTKALKFEDLSLRALELWRTKLTRGGRIVFEVALDFSETSSTWKEMLRLWVITLSHDRYEAELRSIQASHRKSTEVREKLKLEPLAPRGLPGPPDQRLPRDFRALKSEEDALDEGRAGNTKGSELCAQDMAGDVELREHFPPASSSRDTYTLLKFYNLSANLVNSVLQGLDDAHVDFPFRVSPAEQRIINLQTPTSIILLGRSGTGKTTCAVYRMWARCFTFHHHSTETFHQVFLTASATLREQVAKAFRKLQCATLGPQAASLADAAAQRELHTLANVPTEAFLLFLTTK